MIIKVLDFETNGFADDADAWEFGWQDLVDIGQGWELGRRDSCYLYSDQPADPEAQAIHHITEAQVRDAYPLERQWRKAHNWGADSDHIVAYAAHNIATEQKYAGEMAGAVPWICTMKCAMRVWPACPSFANQVIRYWLKIKVPRADLDYSTGSHQAGPDAYVTALTLLELLKVEGLDTLIGWTKEPKLYPRLTFGKHKGLVWPEVPSDYLDWMIYKSRGNQGMDDWGDWQAAARREVTRRYTARG